MNSLNVGVGDPVVIVPLAHNSSSLTQGTRAYWTLKYFGHDRVALLDGGMAKWVAEKRETVTAPAAPGSGGDYKAGAVREEILARTPDVLAAVQRKDVQLLDGRTAEFYLGEKKKDYVYAKGHIPGARLVPNTELANPGTKAFKTAAELKQVFANGGIDAGKPVITYCDSGQLSTGAWFVAHELMGNRKARMYDGSMHEWTKDSSRPVTTARE
jgi:thiosulfate/3-mercaptopyruvate sulfurtransferase